MNEHQIAAAMMLAGIAIVLTGYFLMRAAYWVGYSNGRRDERGV